MPDIKNRLFIVCDLGGKTLRKFAREAYAQETSDQSGADAVSKARRNASKHVESEELKQVVVIAGGPEGYFKDVFESKDAMRILEERGAPCFVSTLCTQDQFTASIQAYFVQSLDMNWKRYKIIHRYLLRKMALAKNPPSVPEGGFIQIPAQVSASEDTGSQEQVGKKTRRSGSKQREKKEARKAEVSDEVEMDEPAPEETEESAQVTNSEEVEMVAEDEDDDLDANLLDDALASLSAERKLPTYDDDFDMAEPDAIEEEIDETSMIHSELPTISMATDAAVPELSGEVPGSFFEDESLPATGSPQEEVTDILPEEHEIFAAVEEQVEQEEEQEEEAPEAD